MRNIIIFVIINIKNEFRYDNIITDHAENRIRVDDKGEDVGIILFFRGPRIR